MRERYRDWYLENRDPVPEARLRWRAQLFRQLVHLLPGDRVLELGTGKGAFANHLRVATRGENEIVGLTFDGIESEAPPRERFDFVVCFDAIDSVDAVATLQLAMGSLKPGGEAVFFASNPGNPFLGARRAARKIAGNPDPRGLMNRDRLEREARTAGFVEVFSLFNDFLYAPLTQRGARLFHGLSAIMENVPGVRAMSGAIVLHGTKPGVRPVNHANLAEHRSLQDAVSVVVPCHNEEMNLRSLVSRLLELYGGYIHEIILVDDNSSDATRDVISELAAVDSRVRGLFRKPPAGVGFALRDGYQEARGQYVLSLDADFEQLLPEIRDMFDAAAAGADAVVGSRFSPDSVLLNYPVQKIVANRAFHLLASIILGSPFRDVTNNLKLMRVEVARRIAFTEQGFAVNAETGFTPMVSGFTTVEVPISWVGRTAEMGSSSFRLAAAGPGYLRVLKRLRALRHESR